ncbi:MAG: hypothetical protein ACFE0R_00045 [Salinarimonas sp.]
MFRSSRVLRLCALVLTLAAALLVLAPAPPAEAQEVLVARWVDRDGHELARRGFAIDTLEALAPATVVTTTPWTEGVMRFTGPRLDTLAALEPQDGEVIAARMTALNEYTIEVPAQDWSAHDLVLATRADGQRMRVRDGGPIWLVYPLDADPSLQTQQYYYRMIWQLREIVFVVGAA